MRRSCGVSAPAGGSCTPSWQSGSGDNKTKLIRLSLSDEVCFDMEIA